MRSGDWKRLVEVCEHLGILCSSPAVDLASTLEVMMYCGTVRHSVAIPSGCPTSTAAHILLDTAQMWWVGPRFLETIPDLYPLCLYMPCAHMTQRTTCVLFAREQEILQSCNKNPLLGHSYSCRNRRAGRSWSSSGLLLDSEWTSLHTTDDPVLSAISPFTSALHSFS